jgi:hypothetical protein
VQVGFCAMVCNDIKVKQIIKTVVVTIDTSFEVTNHATLQPSDLENLT